MHTERLMAVLRQVAVLRPVAVSAGSSIPSSVPHTRSLRGCWATRGMPHSSSQTWKTPEDHWHLHSEYWNVIDSRRCEAS